MDYEQIKLMAKETGCRVKDLFVLAPQNDPFYVGTKSTLELAQWFSQLWNLFGYSVGVHLRRMHYQIISQKEPVILPNGKPYENTNNCWSTLDCASKYARYLGLVNPDSFVDRRNGKPLLFEDDPDQFENEIRASVYTNLYFTDFSFPPFPDTPEFKVNLFTVKQPYHLEIWAEKSTMNDILEPLCNRYKVNLITGVGELSITHVKMLVNRMVQYGKPCRVLYVSDFDPAGMSMPVAVSRKIEKFMQDSDSDFDMRVFPIILTHEQCLEYQLPRTPIKDGEKRAGRFEERFGAGATELDALEALHPGKLREIIREAILCYYDNTLEDRVSWVRNGIVEEMQDFTESVIHEHKAEIDELMASHESLENEFQEKMYGLQRRIENVWQGITNEIELMAPDFEAYELPEPRQAEEIGVGLFDSKRSYMEQLGVYKCFQGKFDVTNKTPGKGRNLPGAKTTQKRGQ